METVIELNFLESLFWKDKSNATVVTALKRLGLRNYKNSST